MFEFRLPFPCVVVLCGGILCGTSVAAGGGGGKKLTAPPDLTQGGEPDEMNDWRLGPTGLQGWVWAQHMRKGASRDARQILVTRVAKDSPADGKVQLNDVILGVDGKPFSRDARRVLAEAIAEAEKRENHGRLRLSVWRNGQTLDIVLTLPAIGGYSDSAPYSCEKSAAVIELACRYLKGKPLKDNWEGYIAALGLMATGRKDVMPGVSEFARKICVPGEVLNVETHEGMLCWKWAYKTLFLTEYYLLTRDAYVLPTIREYATKIAMGQSGVGTWGHTVAARANTGYLHGHLGGYGAMNQISLVLMIDLVLAEKCGITHPEITRAIRLGRTFFEYYTGKGAIPYGDHKPAPDWFDDNGKSASAAVMFDLLGDHHGSEFFSAMVVASSPGGREQGHTGCFWSHLWGGMGAARSGREGLSTFFREMRWAFELERGWDGSMAYQGNAGEKGTKGKPKTKWDSTGARLLQLCVPREKLFITGKQMRVENPLRGDQLGEAVAAGRFIADPGRLKVLPRQEILAMLGSGLPPARQFAARSLVEQDIRCVDTLIEMLDSDSVHARKGACAALRVAGFRSEKAVARLVEVVQESDDLSLRLDAIDALSGADLQRGLAAVAKPAIPALLEQAMSHSLDDPRRQLQRKLCFALFYSGRALPTKGLIPLHGTGEIDRPLMIAAVKELLTVDDGRARGCIGSIYPELTTEDLELLWGDIFKATRDLSPSGIMFADGIRISGLKLMQRLSMPVGVELSTKILTEDRWGRGNRERAVLPVLAAYGPAASKALPVLKSMKMKDMTQLNKTIKAIESE